MDALELFRAGKLQEAIDACNREVQKRPTQPDHRDLLSQLLCFTGDFERADKHLDVLGAQFPDRGAVVALIRQLIRAAQARQQFFDEGRLPEFLAPPPEYLQDHLQASICLRQGDSAEAARLLVHSDQIRPRVCGKCNGEAFQNLRDADDLTAPIFEAFTTTGKYYWLPLDCIRRVLLHPPESPIDILWRRCQIQVVEGPTALGSPNGIVYLPQLYAGSHRAEDESIRLGRSTDWLGPESGPVQGIGHRILWVDDETRPLVNIDSLELAPAEQSQQ